MSSKLFSKLLSGHCNSESVIWLSKEFKSLLNTCHKKKLSFEETIVWIPALSKTVTMSNKCQLLPLYYTDWIKEIYRTLYSGWHMPNLINGTILILIIVEILHIRSLSRGSYAYAEKKKIREILLCTITSKTVSKKSLTTG